MALIEEERENIEKLISAVEEVIELHESELENVIQERDELSDSSVSELLTKLYDKLNLKSETLLKLSQEREVDLERLDRRIEHLEKEKRKLEEDLEKLENYLATL